MSLLKRIQNLNKECEFLIKQGKMKKQSIRQNYIRRYREVFEEWQEHYDTIRMGQGRKNNAM